MLAKSSPMPSFRTRPNSSHTSPYSSASIFGEHVEHALGQGIADRPGAVVLLQDFPGDVERQVAGVHHAAHEAQVQGQELVRLVHDEHALHVELQAAGHLPVPKVERRTLGDVEQARVVELALHLVVAPRRRVVEVVGDVLVELLVLVVVDVVARSRPQRLRRVDCLEFRRVLSRRLVVVPVAGLLGHHHRDAHVVRVLAHHGAQPEAIGELLGVGLQGQGHPGSARAGRRVSSTVNSSSPRGGPNGCRRPPRHALSEPRLRSRQ